MKKRNSTYFITITALMAALCFVAFSLIQFKIPTPAGPTSFHLGNLFCILAALLFGPLIGGLAGAIGMGLGDILDPAYLITAPKTIFLKFLMGFVCGYIAHYVFKIDKKQGKGLKIAAFISILIACIVNIIAEPLTSYFYYGLILDNATKAVSYLTIAKYITTSVNALVTLLLAFPAYLSIRKYIKHIK